MTRRGGERFANFETARAKMTLGMSGQSAAFTSPSGAPPSPTPPSTPQNLSEAAHNGTGKRKRQDFCKLGKTFLESYLKVWQSSEGTQRQILVAEIVKTSQLRVAELDASWWTALKVNRGLTNLDQKEKLELKKAAAAAQGGTEAGEIEDEIDALDED